MIEFGNSNENFDTSEPLDPLDTLGWHRILPGEHFEIVECRELNGNVWLAMSSQACRAGFAHYMRVVDIVDKGDETFFVLALRPDSEIPGPDSWPRNLVAKFDENKQLYALSDRAFEDVEEEISKSLQSPCDVLTRAKEIFELNLLDWDSEQVLDSCPYEPVDDDSSFDDKENYPVDEDYA